MTPRWTPPTILTLWAAGFAGIVTIATAFYLTSIYESLPIGLAVQQVVGELFIYQVKSPSVVMLPFTVQASLLTIFGALVLLLLWSPTLRAVDEDRAEADRKRMSVAAEGIALLATIWITMQAFGAVRLIMLWRGALGSFGDVYSMALLAAVLSSILVMTRTIRQVGRQRRVERPLDPSVWRLRELYFNPADPALFVPTRTGAGWTLNFGRPIAIGIMAVTLIVGIGGPFVFARYILHGLITN